MRSRQFAFILILAVCGQVYAHPWHQHTTIDEVHDDMGAGVGFSIPDSAGNAPTDSEAVARIAESVAPFHDVGVSYRWDDEYFYLESDGLPEHDVFVGITSWQQQISLPQNYSSNNSFRLPLNPEISDSPISVLERVPTAASAAMGVAVNGIPIFPALNNRNEDTVVIGELDIFGGHAGRGDDYHYHAAPLHLVDIVGIENPIGFGYDGFPIYGLTEADGSEVTGLDEFNGQFDEDGNYHYHATENFPYHMGGLRGVVEIAANGRIVQPRDSPVRQALQPLRGAEITDFEQIDETTQSVTYTQNGQDNVVRWSWDVDTNDYTFDFISPDGTVRTETYRDRYQALPDREDVVLTVGEVADGIVTVTAQGEPGFGFQLQASADGENWESFGHALIDEDGDSEFDLSLLGDVGFLRVFDGEPTVVEELLCDPNTNGDVDGNGTVEFVDFRILAGNFGMSVSSHAQGDINCNGTVEFTDFLALAENFGRVVATDAVSVPEPSGFLVAGIAALGLFRRRRAS